MKTLLLLGCSVLLTACGSSNSSTADAGVLTQATPVDTSQTPQPPADSIPPANSQQAPLNSQQAPTNSQQPSGTGSATGSPLTCAQAVQQLQLAGCDTSNFSVANCEAELNAHPQCSAQFQDELACLLREVVCNAGGTNVDQICSNEDTALSDCVNSQATSQSCTAASNCAHCASACASCQCSVELGSGLDCSSYCGTTTN